MMGRRGTRFPGAKASGFYSEKFFVQGTLARM